MPQRTIRVRLLRQVNWRERGRLHALHVPQVEIFMTHQAKESPILIRYAFVAARRQVIATANQRR
jgi:hypothetical protein